LDGLECELKVTFFAETTCVTEGLTKTLTNCASPFGDGAEFTATPKQGSTCSPSGGQLSGDVQPSNATQVCCTSP
jgi:hypothetical protein